MIDEEIYQRKVLEAQHRLEALWYETEGKCFISFSGGKDSTVLLALVKQCAEIGTLPADGIKAVYSNTGIEMGVTIDFVKKCAAEWYPNIEIIRPAVSFDWVIKNKGKPLMSKMKSEDLGRWQKGVRSKHMMHEFMGIGADPNSVRSTKIPDKYMHMIHEKFDIKSSPSCCDYLKKKASKKYMKDHGMIGQAVGLRTEEGGARKINVGLRVKQGGLMCTSYLADGTIKKAPIIDWTEEEVEEYIRRNNVPLSDAYTKYGFDRTGCMACPFGKYLVHDLTYLHDHEPNRYKAAMHWLKDVYIAQNVSLPFDPEYERERERKWNEEYEPMRQEMLRKYRPESHLINNYWQTYLEI